MRSRSSSTTRLIVTYNGKTFDVPVMETRWMFHRMEHAARRRSALRHAASGAAAVEGDAAEASTPAKDGCRLGTLERVLFDVTRVGDVPGFEIPARYFRFLRSGDPRPLEPVLEHNRLDLVSLAAVTAHAVRLVDDGPDGCRDARRRWRLAGLRARRLARSCRGLLSPRRGRPMPQRSAPRDCTGWDCDCGAIADSRRPRTLAGADRSDRALRIAAAHRGGEALRQFAVEALAIHTSTAIAICARRASWRCSPSTKQPGDRTADSYRHRLARLDRKIAER